MPGPSIQNSKKHSSGVANAVLARGFRASENFTPIMFSITDIIEQNIPVALSPLNLPRRLQYFLSWQAYAFPRLSCLT